MSGNHFNHEVSDVGAPLEIPVGSGRRNNPLSLAVGLVCLALIGVNLRPGIVRSGHCCRRLARLSACRIRRRRC